MSGKKSGLPDGRVPDRNPDGTRPCLGKAAGLKVFFPFGWSPLQVAWQ